MPHCLEVSTWETPASKYVPQKIGGAEITKRRQGRGVYRMEGVGGYIFWENKKPITLTSLKIRDRVWMTDEPINWLGMQLLAKHSKGKVLVGGLGLGLIVHALLNNPEVNEIDVYEVEPRM